VYILAADASSQYCSVALWKDQTIICDLSINNGLVHSKTLMPMIEQALTLCETDIKSIDLFAASVGPGSFTGVRIAVSTIKALAQATNKPCAAVNTLEAAYYNIIDNGQNLICPILDARRGQVYGAVYCNGQEILALQAISVDELCTFLNQKAENTVFTGDGMPIHREKINSLMGNKAIFAPPQLMYQRAAAAAQLAYRDYCNQCLLTYEELDAFYLRKPQAEREYDSRHSI
jgi:tRNA threonylcarbamoyladenosine biosynthesis protein TsaB